MTSTQPCSFIPGYLLERIADAGGPGTASARSTLVDGEQVRTRRELRATRWPSGHPLGSRGLPGAGGVLDTTVAAPPQAPAGEPLRDEGPSADDATPVEEVPQPERLVYDAAGGTELPGTLARTQSEPATGDPATDQAFDGLGTTFDLLATAYDRWSLDDAGLALVASVHYGQDYANAFWDGAQMVLGDGDGRYFRGFTESLDVMAHELGHGLVQFTAGLVYVGQPGALNESVCDVVGSLVRQRSLGQQAEEADWLIGAGLFTDRVQGVALRSMAAPGTAYDDPVLGKDPQPGHLDDYVDLPHDASGDNGGVHINSGIPNRAFHLFATTVGGFAWERAGQVWYDVLVTPGAVPKDVDFAGFAAATVTAATARYGEAGDVVTALRAAWDGVGVDAGVGA